jgi:hypothetical protein
MGRYALPQYLGPPEDLLDDVVGRIEPERER